MIADNANTKTGKLPKEAPVKGITIEELRLSALRNLNSLTRAIQDLDRFTAERDIKNIEKLERSTAVASERLKCRFKCYVTRN